MILEVILCTTLAKLDCETSTINLPPSTTLKQCMTIRQNMLADKTGMILPLAPYREVNCK